MRCRSSWWPFGSGHPDRPRPRGGAVRRARCRMALHLHTWGPRDAPPVLVVHGVRNTGARYRRLAEEGLPHRRVIAPDLRGHGSSAWDPPWDVATHVADLVALLDDEGLGPVPVIGHSFGGFLALRLAAAVPDRVSRGDPARSRGRTFPRALRGERNRRSHGPGPGRRVGQRGARARTGSPRALPRGVGRWTRIWPRFSIGAPTGATASATRDWPPSRPGARWRTRLRPSGRTRDPCCSSGPTGRVRERGPSGHAHARGGPAARRARHRRRAHAVLGRLRRSGRRAAGGAFPAVLMLAPPSGPAIEVVQGPTTRSSAEPAGDPGDDPKPSPSAPMGPLTIVTAWSFSSGGPRALEGRVGRDREPWLHPSTASTELRRRIATGPL